MMVPDPYDTKLFDGLHEVKRHGDSGTKKTMSANLQLKATYHPHRPPIRQIERHDSALSHYPVQACRLVCCAYFLTSRILMQAGDTRQTPYDWAIVGLIAIRECCKLAQCTACIPIRAGQ